MGDPWVAAAGGGTLAALTIIGNCLVLVAVAFRKSIRSIRSNMFITSLALTDLILGLVGMPLNVDFLVNGGVWRHGDGACAFWIFADIFVCTASVWNLVAIAADRLVAINWPVVYMGLRRRSAICVLVLAWLLSLVICLPPMVIPGNKILADVTFSNNLLVMNGIINRYH